MSSENPIQRLNPRDIVEGRVLTRTPVHYFEHAGVRELERLDTGVLFIFAWWSGSAHITLDHLTKALLNLCSPPDFDFFIVNTDGIPELYQCDLLRGRLHGHGESVWKRKSTVVGTMFHIGQIEEYEERVTKVLA